MVGRQAGEMLAANHIAKLTNAMPDVFLGEGDEVVRQLDALEVAVWKGFTDRVRHIAGVLMAPTTTTRV